MNLDTLGNIADIIAIPIALVGVYLVIKQLYLARIESENEHKRRKEITLNAYNAIREELRETSKKVRETLQLENMFSQLDDNHVQQIYLNRDLKNDVTKMLSIMERFALGVHHDVFDINLINDLSGTVFIQTFKQFKPYIEKSRENSKTFYTDYEKLANELEILRR